MTDRRAVEIELPGSKSVTHRAFVLGAQCAGGALIRRPLLSADTRATLDGLTALGATAELLPNADVRFGAASWRQPPGPLQCQNSGTTMRLLTGLAATWSAPVELDGDASLRRRPNGPLLAALAEMGATVQSHQGRAPLRVCGPIQPGRARLDASVSSQYISSLALAATRLAAPSVITAAAPVASRPYLDITVRAAAAFGLDMEISDSPEATTLRVRGAQQPIAPAAGYVVPADWSSAAFPLVAALIGAIPVRVGRLDRDSAQGDRAIIEVLQRFGATVSWVADGIVQVRAERLISPGEVNIASTPDMFPALCALAARAEGVTTLDGAPSLRHKECDRIAAMVGGLQALGIACRELPGGAVIEGGDVGGGDIECHGDHRVHMAFAILDPVAAGRVRVNDPGCVAVSYPTFHEDLGALLRWRASE